MAKELAREIRRSKSFGLGFPQLILATGSLVMLRITDASALLRISASIHTDAGFRKDIDETAANGGSPHFQPLCLYTLFGPLQGYNRLALTLSTFSGIVWHLLQGGTHWSVDPFPRKRPTGRSPV